MPSFNTACGHRFLYVSRVTKQSPIEACRSWRPGLDGVSEVFHASFTEHAYPLHCHDTWTVLLVDSGAVRYELDKHQRAADPQRVTILPPFVAHDGRSAVAGKGFRKRVLYLDSGRIGEEFIGAAVDQSAIEDGALRRTVSLLHQSLDRRRDDLEQESLLALVTERIAEVLAGRTSQPRSSSRAAMALREVLDENPYRTMNLDSIATEVGWSTTHLIRSFTKQFGLPPHRYLISRRIDEARRQLLAGTPPAEVAVNVGFHDQAHLGRHFKSHVGVPPGRYRPSDR